MSTCPAGTPAYFTGSTVFIQPETPSGDGVWSSPVTMYAYCGSVDSAHALSNVVVTGVMVSSTGIIADLEVSADGTLPTTVVGPFPGTALPTTGGLQTDANGMVQFTLRARSDVQPFLAGQDGAPQLIGLQLDFGSGTGTLDDGATFTYPLGGFGGIFAQTPELDSLVLFGSGAAGLAGHVALRLRAGRRRG